MAMCLKIQQHHYQLIQTNFDGGCYMKKFCVLQNNVIVTAYDYPLTGEMALMPISRLNEMGVLLNVPDDIHEHGKIFTINPNTGCIDGFEYCADELDSLYEYTVRQTETVDALILDNLVMTEVVDTLVLAQLEG